MNLVAERFEACSKCRVCEGAAYQAPPALYAGSFDSDILIVDQQTYTISEDVDDDVYAMGASEFKRWYDAAVMKSAGYPTMTKVFGEDWLKRYTFTSAVRCRMKHDAKPTTQMMVACSIWTNILMEDKASVVLVGVDATPQQMSSIPPVGEIVTYKRWKILRISHYTDRYVEWDKMQTAFKQLEEGIK